MGHYLQSITPSLALGTEIAHQRSPVPGGQITVVSAVGRFTSGESTISASVGKRRENVLQSSSLSVDERNIGIPSRINFSIAIYHDRNVLQV